MTKQARKTAKRKARQASAYAAFKAIQSDPEVLERLKRREFFNLSERSKQLVVEKLRT